MSLIDILLAIIILCLMVWMQSLRRAVQDLQKDIHYLQSDTQSITPQELKQIQRAMIELVQNMESYSDSQVLKMKLQAEAIQTISMRLDDKVQALYHKVEELEKKQEETHQTTLALQENAVAVPTPSRPISRVVPLTPNQNPVIHKNRETILELYQKGWSYEKIAEELRITKGEVQLVVKLS
ncbi:MAG: hypothetical protein RBU29_16070 [bacterium]|jgi:DNA-binding NarL/FixJ family response regulator|nr:hypothetical protein [bacterium]